MPKKNDSWGIEVGANAIKAMRLERSGDRVSVVDFDILPFKQILTTPDLNVDETIQVGLDTFLSKHEVSRSAVVVSVPGHMAFARFAKLPPVEPKKIPDIVRFEAVQQIPFPIDQVEWDYQVFQQADAPDVEVGIFAITKERVIAFLNNYRQVNLRVDALTLSPLAVYNAFAYEAAMGEDPPGTIYMDIGTSSTDVIIVEHGGIWLRTLPIGGNSFTEALVRAFKLSFPKAEKLKREAGTSKYARQIFQAMRPVFADLVQELQRSLGYYQSLNRDAHLKRLVGVGSTFRLPGLQKFLKQQLKMEVVRPDGFKRLSVEGRRESELAENALNLATAYGLALQGLGLERVSANILPKHIMRQRLWKAKQPWIGAAAACVALSCVTVGARYFIDRASHQSQFQEKNPRIQAILSQAQQYESQWQQIKSNADPRMRIENLRRMLDYRDLWPKLIEDISQAAQAGTPPVLLTNQFEEIAKIPRAQRRRIYIDSIRSQYVVESTAADADSAAAGYAYGPYGMPGMPAPGGRGGAAAGGQIPPEAALSQPHTVEDFFKEDGSTPPPRFIITVTGTTPLPVAEAARFFVNEGFIRWINDHADRPDRPYKFLIEGNPITSLQPLEEAGLSRQGTRGRTPSFRRPTTPTFRGRTAAPPVPDEAFMDPALMDPAMMMPGGVPGRRATGSFKFADLLPEPPLGLESQAGDSRFEIRWIVELRSPSAARQAESPEPAAVPVVAPPAQEQPQDSEPPQEPDQQQQAQLPAARIEEDPS